MFGAGIIGLISTPRQEDPQISVPLIDVFVLHYVDTITVVQEQPYDQYDIAHCVETSLMINMI
jgi:hypothetical protein